MGLDSEPPLKLPVSPMSIAAAQTAAMVAIRAVANRAARARESAGAGIAGTSLTNPLGAPAPRSARNALIGASTTATALGASRVATVTGKLFGQQRRRSGSTEQRSLASYCPLPRVRATARVSAPSS